jgi:hypothetical protein
MAAQELSGLLKHKHAAVLGAIGPRFDHKLVAAASAVLDSQGVVSVAEHKGEVGFDWAEEGGEHRGEGVWGKRL